MEQCVCRLVTSLLRLLQVDLSFFSNSTFGQFVRHMLLKGTLQDHTVLQKRLRIVLEDVTFLDAYNKSGAPITPVAKDSLSIWVVSGDLSEQPGTALASKLFISTS